MDSDTRENASGRIEISALIRELNEALKHKHVINTHNQVKCFYTISLYANELEVKEISSNVVSD